MDRGREFLLDVAMVNASRTWRRRVFAAIFATGGLASSVNVAQAVSGPVDPLHAIHISTLSARPHLISGGDVLVSIKLPHSTKPSEARITLNQQDISGAFIADDASHSLMGMVTGLRLGKNSLIAFSANARDGSVAARLTLTNYPITGPIISGSQQEPRTAPLLSRY